MEVLKQNVKDMNPKVSPFCDEHWSCWLLNMSFNFCLMILGRFFKMSLKYLISVKVVVGHCSVSLATTRFRLRIMKRGKLVPKRWFQLEHEVFLRRLCDGTDQWTFYPFLPKGLILQFYPFVSYLRRESFYRIYSGGSSALSVYSKAFILRNISNVAMSAMKQFLLLSRLNDVRDVLVLVEICFLWKMIFLRKKRLLLHLLSISKILHLKKYLFLYEHAPN